MKRLIVGKRGSAYGIWLSKPGIDVETAPDEDLLFGTSDDVPLLNFFIKGEFTLAPGANTTVYYGTTFPSPPLVQLYQRLSSEAFFIENSPVAESLRILQRPAADHCYFLNNSGSDTLVGRFVVFARSIQ